MSTQATENIVPLRELHGFVVRCMKKVGSPEDHATALADLLTTADHRGHYSHGLNRLDMYVRDIQLGITVHNAEPVVIKETAATALVDGNNVLGPVVGRYCMDLAVQKAKQSGIGLISARGSNHFGIAGWYSMRAVEHGLLGMAFTNTSPVMVPTRACKPTLGSNPLSLAAPANDGDSLVLDMATTAVALGKLEINHRKGMDIPTGWGVDASGKTCTDPTEVIENGGLLPLGGTEDCSGYKGYGLGMLVEVLCGLLAGADYGPNIRQWKSADGPANLGQCFIAIDPSAFAPGFTDRMSDLIDHCRHLEPAEGETEVLVPGDPERKHMEKCTQLGGIPYHPNQIQYAKKLASEFKVRPLKSLQDLKSETQQLEA